MTAEATRSAIEATFRIERARLVARLARMMRDVDRAEEFAQEALLIALAEWPKSGVPHNPGAWLTATAKRRAVDALRRDRMRERKHAEIARELGEGRDTIVEDVEAALDDDLGDELLGLIFTACHPVISPDARAISAVVRPPTRRKVRAARARSCRGSRPSRSGSCARRGPSPKRASPSRCRAALSARSGSAPCSPSST